MSSCIQKTVKKSPSRYPRVLNNSLSIPDYPISINGFHRAKVVMYSPTDISAVYYHVTIGTQSRFSVYNYNRTKGLNSQFIEEKYIVQKSHKGSELIKEGTITMGQGTVPGKIAIFKLSGERFGSDNQTYYSELLLFKKKGRYFKIRASILFDNKNTISNKALLLAEKLLSQ